MEKHGIRKWSQIAQMLKGRIGKQCRERWHNHLRPDIKVLISSSFKGTSKIYMIRVFVRPIQKDFCFDFNWELVIWPARY